MNLIWLLFIATLLQAACGNPVQTRFDKATSDSPEQSSKSELNQVLESEVLIRDENGDITEIKGLTYSEKM